MSFPMLGRALCLAVFLFGLTAPCRGQEKETKAQLEARIAKLVKQLGDEKFARRERAQSELARLGMMAFDALQEAQVSDDIEVAMRARYLVRSIRVHWVQESDSAEVKRVLENYGSQSSEDRAARMDRLASLPDSQGLVALCRLVRFEASKKLSKRAALIAINLPLDDDDKAAREKRAKLIDDTVSISKRKAADWLRLYVQTLREPDKVVDAWANTTTEERRILAEFPEQTTPDIVRDLLRWQVDLSRRHNRRDDVAKAVKQMIQLLGGRREEVLNTVDWLLDRELYAAVDQVAEQFPQQIDKYLVLQYRLAESSLKQGREEQAQQIAEQAAKTREGNYEEHLEAAVALQDRGLIEWCVREHRQIIDKSDAGSLFSLRSRFILSELLHDLEQELEAAKVLQGVVDLMSKDRAVLERVQQPPLNRPPGGVNSRMHFFYGLHYKSKGENEKQFEHFRDGIKGDATDSDLLIGMYQASGADKKWKEMTSRYIETAVTRFRTQIQQLREFSAQAPNESTRNDLLLALAASSNQMAWLVSNTEGDKDEALRSSLKSLEIRPDTAAYLDTLAHCYHAKGDFANAVKSQTRAVKLEPHTRQISRKLEIFKKALQDAQQKE